MVEATGTGGKISFRTKDGRVTKVDIDIACKQSTFIADYVENTQQDYEGEHGSLEGLSLNKVEINLSEQTMIDHQVLKKVVEFWEYVETKCTLPEIPKPLPAIKDNQTGNVKCDLFLILPPWFANFINTKFADKEDLC